MKKLVLMLFTVALIITNKSLAQENFKWAEMNSFHATAMGSFHSAEINKLQPVKDSASSILLKAQAWQSSPVPTGIDAMTIRPLLQNLVDDCKAINDAVAAKKSDAYLKPLVLKAHNIFHDIIRRTK